MAGVASTLMLFWFVLVVAILFGIGLGRMEQKLDKIQTQVEQLIQAKSS